MDKPVKKTYEVEYWSCDKDGHHHKNEDIAAKCMKKGTGERRHIISDDESAKLNLEVLKCWLQGLNAAQTKKITGKPAQYRMNQIIRVARSIKEYPRFPMSLMIRQAVYDEMMRRHRKHPKKHRGSLKLTLDGFKGVGVSVDEKLLAELTEENRKYQEAYQQQIEENRRKYKEHYRLQIKYPC